MLNSVLVIVVLTGLIGCTPSISAADKAKLATAEQMIDAWNTMEWERVYELFSDDAVLHSMMSEPLLGRAAIRERLSGLVGGLDRIELQVRTMGVIDDVVVLERVDDFTYNGKHSRVPVVGVMEITDGRVVEWREYYDKASLINALVAADGNDDQEAGTDVLAVIKTLQKNWNDGDMQAYLGAYWDHEDLTLVFGDQVVTGKQDMARMFTTTWPDEEKMGDFAVDNLNAITLGPNLATVSGTFQHQFTDELVVGAFSHVLKRIDSGEWRIVHEHTSRRNDAE